MSGRQSTLPPGVNKGGRSKCLYRCQAVGCKVTPRGNDLGKHYKNNTDWSLVKRIKEAVGDVAVEVLLSKADPHTRFIVQKKYSKDRLPYYSSHVMVKETEGEGSSASTSSSGQKQLTMSSFFQVSNN